MSARNAAVHVATLNRKKSRLLRIWYGSISASALVAGLAMPLSSAQATDFYDRKDPVSEDTVVNGRDASNSWGDDGKSTPGRDGLSIDHRIFGRIGDPSRGSAGQGTVYLVSHGGAGGNGYVTEYGLWTRNDHASLGGKGKDVRLVQNGTLWTSSKDHAAPVSLIRMQSVGGRGGHGAYSAGDWIPGKQGAESGMVTLELLKSTNTAGKFYSVAHLTSRGGEGGANSVDPASNKGGNSTTARVTIGTVDFAGIVPSVRPANTVTISTHGVSAPAVIVESIGGAGGKRHSGGNWGGHGGDSGSVSVQAVQFINGLEGQVITYGNASTAVVLQSAGGRGGDIDSSNGRIAGNGGNGGNAGEVHGTNHGLIETHGHYSFGIVAQSVGGAGGAGGTGYFHGGDGGSSGSSGLVSIKNRGTISTAGNASVAIVAQSIGGGTPMDAFDSESGTYKTGGGGDGGEAWFGLFFAKGGDGGRGSAAGTVKVENDGDISTRGKAAHGIQAQSIGGGGGKGGDATSGGQLFSVAVGGTAGGGGAGGTVEIGLERTAFEILNARGRNPDAIRYSTITTRGDAAYAIQAQSIGGGGGTGGTATAYGVAAIASVAVSVGGSGGDGGSGNAVSIWNTSKLTTHGAGSKAVYAQSIGGGGGDAGAANSYAIAVSAKNIPAVSAPISIGGTGGKGGHGGEVTVRSVADIVTHGQDSIAIDAQSIGGGGGHGGGAYSYALAAQLGGAPSIAIPVAVGGKGGEAGHGKKVYVSNSARITTYGTNSGAIAARSIGGGGGTGGNSKGVADLIGFYNGLALPLSFGGDGKGGGNGGVVEVHNYAEIETFGQFSDGITAVSIGGGGGTGGTADAAAQAGISADWFKKSGLKDNVGWIVPTGDNVTANVIIGGKGDGGGNGGAVTISNSGSIRTSGSNSNAILATSIGGGGGIGGGFLGGGEGTLNLTFRAGGQGGKGGDGGAVTVTNEGTAASISTQGAGSHAIYAQSVGGGGGTGGSFTGKRETTYQFAMPNDVNEALSFAFKLAAEIQTVNKGAKTIASDDKPKDWEDPNNKGQWKDKDRQKIYESNPFNDGSSMQKKLADLKNIMDAAKNIKGLVTDDQKTWEDKFLESASFSHAKLVGQIMNDAKKDLVKKLKEAALNGNKPHELPEASLTASVGGTGGVGGSGATVTIANNRASIATAGENSYGIFAQSVGGGGGAGGAAYTYGTQVVNINLTVGGKGGAGGAGGTVEIGNSGNIATKGVGSYGIFAQSVGGGGGVGGGSESANDLSFSANFSLGGDGGAKGDGGVVKVSNSGSIRTEGDNAHALVAQSIGGGGGAYFLNLYDPAEARKKMEEEALKIANAPATDQELLKQAQEALAATESLLKALGISADGGGEGGEAAYNDATTILPKPAANFTFGGAGGAGGAGGSVEVRNRNEIVTSGVGAIGIFAQSIGGGGGFGSSGKSGGLFQVGTSLGGSGGAAGHGGQVLIELGKNSSVTTSGKGAHAIAVQSIGGGGGHGGVGERTIFNGRVSTEKAIVDGATSGDGGKVIVRMLAEDKGASKFFISTTGEQAHGIYAQSIGGGGGMVTLLNNGKPAATESKGTERVQAKGKGGEIEIKTEGTISATGVDSYGIFAQSGVQKTDGSLLATDRTGRIQITHTGNITGGSGNGAAVRIDGGPQPGTVGKDYRENVNSITFESGSVIQALSGTAIVGSFGQDEIHNHGTIIGHTKVNGYAPNEINRITNYWDGVYRTGNYGLIDLGAHKDSAFINRGVLDIGGINNITTAELKGNLIVESGGRLLVDISKAGDQNASDRLNVTGKTTFMAGGGVQPNAITYLLPGDYHILNSQGGIAGLPSTLGVEEKIVPITWNYTLANGDKDLTLSPQADFANPKGVVLSEEQREVAMVLQELWDEKSDPQGSVFPHFLRIPTAAAYADTLEQFTPDVMDEADSLHLLDIGAALRAPLSCPAFAGPNTTLIQETDCVWGRLDNEYTRSNAKSGEQFKNRELAYRVGAQKEIRPDWFVGFAGAYITNDHSDRDGASKSDSYSYEGSIAIKHQRGPWQFAASATIGNDWEKTNRFISFSTYRALAHSDNQNFYAGALLRGSYTFAYENLYVKPILDVSLMHLRSSSFTEYGAPGLNLHSKGTHKTFYSVNPSVEIGSRFELSNGFTLRPYGSIGFTVMSDDEIRTKVMFVDGGLSGTPFTSTTRIPDRLFNFGAGLHVISDKGFDLTGEYKGSSGDRFMSHKGTAKLSVRF